MREFARAAGVNLRLVQSRQHIATARGGGNLGEALQIHHLVREAEVAVLAPVYTLVLDEALAIVERRSPTVLAIAERWPPAALAIAER